MSSGHQFYPVVVVVFSRSPVPEEPASATHRHLPGILLIVRVRPHQVGEGTLVWGLASAFEKSDLIKGLDVRGKTTVHAHDLALNHSDEAEMVKHLHAVLPGIRVTVLALAFFIESVHSADLACLVVTAQNSNVSWVLDFQAHEELESLNRIETTVHIVAHEHIASVGDAPAFVEELEQVVELAVNVTHNSYRGAHWLHVRLLNQQLLSHLAAETKVSFRKALAVVELFKPNVGIAFATHFAIFNK